MDTSLNKHEEPTPFNNVINHDKSFSLSECVFIYIFQLFTITETNTEQKLLVYKHIHFRPHPYNSLERKMFGKCALFVSNLILEVLSEE